MTQKTKNRIEKLQQLMTFAVLAVIFLSASVANANNRRNKNIQMRMAVGISATGDADVDFNMEMPLREYTMVKGQFGNAQYLGRMMSSSMAWSEIKDLQGKFVDADNIVNAHLTHVGYAKPVKAGKWEIDLSTDDLNLVAIAEDVAHFSTAMDMPFGATNVICRVRLPEGSTNQHYDEDEGLLTYDFVPEFVEGDDGEVDFEIDTKAKMMSSLAKIYGNEKFDNFWVARSKFVNTGDQVIENLRMRHRISGLSAWSGWQKTKIVYPGQTVIEPFFPVMDIEKVAAFTSTRNAMVEVEYSYEMGGEKLTDTDSSKLQVLSRNEVEWSSYHFDEVTSFYELFNNCPQIYGAFTNSNDPVVQQTSAAISRMINGIPPQTDEAAILFMKATWAFMEANRIAYQLPPGNEVDGHFIQHLKYARDVLRNKAGTCADLAVFWASIGKAAGMETVICGVPGHAFPAFVLPESGQVIPIESTLILHKSFEDALKAGRATMNKYMNEGTIYQVNINELRSEGVYCLDLPAVDADFLKNLGYEMDLQLIGPKQQDDGGQSDSGRADDGRSDDGRSEPAPRKANMPQRLMGVWKSEVNGPNGKLEAVIAFNADGECGCATQVTDAYGDIIEEDDDHGTWQADGSTIYTNSAKDGLDYEYPYRFENGYLIVNFDGNELAFKKIKN
jgi:hypothetical protein